MRSDILNQEISEIDKNISELISNEAPTVNFDESIIQGFRDDASDKKEPLQKQISDLRIEINKKIEAQSGVAKSKANSIEAGIRQLDEKIDEITSA